ncbi:hypothetical protein KS4_36130 [Poriferisphaera corsica]|uniref:Flagellar Assembly Protein A N-terminal region domain-containing protein n=1 Tax=Poriferisphaera corsica TaxID=2528020 RepID=A0A517YZ70_9BACT|nr:FapA family protein [Poriferisphaera corsica]QDU35530.1 hypothetical protein KS4_36130 [Poriferisphaera corsica]
MSEAPEQNIIRAITSPDKTSAELVLQEKADRSLINEPLCLTALMEAGIEINDEVSKALQNFLKKAKASRDKEVKHTIATAQLPVHGIDGTVNWIQKDDEAAEGKASHYSRSAFVMVRKNDILGTMVDAQKGTDGRDVTGKTIPAKEPLQCNVEIDPSIRVDKDGNLVAQLDGVLLTSHKFAKIDQLLVIDDNVDFSTGNIDFTGDIEIMRDIRDRFHVKASGSITVQGFVEDATIECGNSLKITKGYAGRTRADTIVLGNLSTKYLDNVNAEVGQNLLIDKEAINSTLIVTGEIKSPLASFIGCNIQVSKAVHVSNLGSAGNVKTTVVLGSVPRLQTLANELNDIIDQFNSHINQLNQKIDQFNQASQQNKLSPKDAEKHTEYMFSVQHINKTLEKAEPTLTNLNARIDDNRKVNVQVDHAIYPNVSFVTDDISYTINDLIKGPVSIFEDTNKQLVFQRSGAKPKPLSDISTVRTLKSPS